MKKTMNIKPPYLIAEIGQAHDGSLGIAHSYIEALKDSGVDAIKFQIHVADAESSIYEPFRINFSYEDKNRYDYWKRMEFNFEQWIGLKNHCNDFGFDFILSPFSVEALEITNQLGCKTLKLGSGETSNKLLLDLACQMDFENIIFSNGLCNEEELDYTVHKIISSNKNPFLLQCTTQYPSQPENWKLNQIKVLHDRYEIPIGYSDHSGHFSSSIAAFVLGAEILEFHVVFDKRMFGPDATSSLTIEETKLLVYSLRQLNQSLTTKTSFDEQNHFNRKIFTKSLSLRSNLNKGSKIELQSLETKKPSGKGISVNEYDKILGKTTTRNLHKGDFLNYKDIE